MSTSRPRYLRHRRADAPDNASWTLRRFATPLLCLFLVSLGCSEGGRVAEVGPSSDVPPTASSPPSLEEMYPPEVRRAMSGEALEGADAGGPADAPASAPAEHSATKATPAGEPTTGLGKGGLDKSAPSGAADSYDDGGDADETSASESLAQMQGGVLTAGSFDDHRRFGDFQNFLTKTMQIDPTESFPRLSLGRRVLIHIHNGQGQPLANTKVEVQPANSQSQQPTFSARTGSDGRALFLTQQDAPGFHGDDYVLTIHKPNGSAVERQVKASSGIWQVEVVDGQMAPPQQLDLALVIDATGSMGDEMNYLKIEIDHIAATVKQMFPNVDQRFALIVYRDHGDAFVTRTFDFTSSLNGFRQRLSKQSANGGGDYPEAMDAAMEAATQLSWRGGNAARVMFLIGDAPPHDRKAKRTLTLANTLRQNNIRVFPVAASGAAWKAEFILRTTAFLTMGEYLFLTDHSGVGNPHAKPHVPDYQVEHLNRMMVRMIAQELAGKKLAPSEVIAIERGDESPLQFQPIQPVVLGSLQQSQQSQAMYCIPMTPPTPQNTMFASLEINWGSAQWFVYGAVICAALLIGAFFNF